MNRDEHCFANLGGLLEVMGLEGILVEAFVVEHYVAKKATMH